MRQPDTAADDAVASDPGISAEDRSAGINHNPVSDIRMALDPLDQSPVLADGEALGSERDVLVELYPLADGGRLSDYDTGAVVDEEIISDGCTGVDVNSGEAMSILRHDTRQQRDALPIEDVRQPVSADRGKGRVAENDFIKAFKKYHGVIVTWDTERQIEEDGLTIDVIPVWKWLLV